VIGFLKQHGYDTIGVYNRILQGRAGRGTEVSLEGKEKRAMSRRYGGSIRSCNGSAIVDLIDAATRAGMKHSPYPPSSVYRVITRNNRLHHSPGLTGIAPVCKTMTRIRAYLFMPLTCGVGGGYSFIHRRLQDYFTDAELPQPEQ
jgi:hypothetical protein